MHKLNWLLLSSMTYPYNGKVYAEHKLLYTLALQLTRALKGTLRSFLKIVAVFSLVD